MKSKSKNKLERLEEKYRTKMYHILINGADNLYEDDHIDADEILCNLLVELGFDDIVRDYNKINKYYS